MFLKVQNFVNSNLQVKLFKLFNSNFSLRIKPKRILKEKIAFFYQNLAIFKDYLINLKQ